MKAIAIDAYGEASNLHEIELPRPTPGPGQVLVRVKASSLNPIDAKVRSGKSPVAPPFPAVLHGDVAGIVEEVGPGASRFQVGDEVYGCAGGVADLQGALAEFMATDERLLAHRPRSLPMEECAALPLVSITAWDGLILRGRVQAGDTVLVHGAAGGVGHLAVQLAKVRGARVAASVSSPEKAELARHLGADDIILYREEDVEAYVERLTGGRGFDIVFDPVGGDHLNQSFLAAKLTGTVVCTTARQTYDLTPMQAKGLTLSLVYMLLAMLKNLNREKHGEILTEIAKLVDAGQVRPLFDPKRFSFRDANQAHTYWESGKAVGKILLVQDCW